MNTRDVQINDFEHIIRETKAGDVVWVDGNLDLRNESDLATLPEKLVVDGWMDLEGCHSLLRLPKEMRVSDWLCVADCTSLIALADGLRLGGWLDIRSTSIHIIPRGVRVRQQQLGLSHGQVVIVPNSRWLDISKQRALIDGSKLSVRTYDALVADPEICRFVANNSFLQQQITEGQLTYKMLQKLRTAQAEQPKRTTLL